METPGQETSEVAHVASGGAVDGVMRRFETDNPYLQRLFAHEAFGEVPSGAGQLLRGLETAHPDELLISAMKVRHGAAQGGVLMVTTHWLRYVKQGRLFTVVANDEFWQLDGSLELEDNLGGRPLFRTPDGLQFQVFPTIPVVSRRQAKAFHGIYKLAALASHSLQGEMEEAALEGMAAKDVSGGTAAEIKELVALRDSGALSDAEFEAAKARVLGS